MNTTEYNSRNILLSLFALAFIFARQLLGLLAEFMGFLQFYGLSEKIQSLLEPQKTEFDIFTFVFFTGVMALILLHRRSIKGFFKWLANFPGND